MSPKRVTNLEWIEQPDTSPSGQCVVQQIEIEAATDVDRFVDRQYSNQRGVALQFTNRIGPGSDANTGTCETVCFDIQ